MINYVIVGAGGFGREVYNWLSDYAEKKYGPQNQAWQFKGYVDDNTDQKFDLPYYKIFSKIDDYIPEPDDRVLISIANPKIRKQIALKLKSTNAKFETLIHPNTYVLPGAKIGEGCIILQDCTISVNVEIGDFTIINSACGIGHDSKIGNFCELAPRVSVSGGCAVEDCVMLASHCVVCPGKSIGKYAKVSACSSVIRNVKPGSFVQGVPGKETKNFFPVED